VVKSRPVKKCLEPFKQIVLSRDRGSVTNNNGVLDWMMGFIGTSLQL
jgi:hypothetical protein